MFFEEGMEYFYNTDYMKKGEYCYVAGLLNKEYAVHKRKPSSCTYCNYFPCIITHNSKYKHKECPCHECIVGPACREVCDEYLKVKYQIFKLYSQE